MKRPARTGVKPARLCATQSAAATGARVRRGGNFFASRVRDQRAQGGFIGRFAEVDRHLPLPAVVLERGADGIVAVESFAEMCRQPPGGRLVAGQAGNGGGCSWRVVYTGCVKPLAMAI